MNTSPCVPFCGPSPQVVNIPGLSGNDGLDGTNGINAFSVTTAPFTLPAIGAMIGVSVDNSSWMVPGQIVVATGPANFAVAAAVTTTSATLMFLGYPGDVAPGTVIGAGATISPAGLLGGGWSPLSQKQDQSVTDSAALVASALTFQMLAATIYRIRGVVFFDTTASGDFKYGFTAPSAPTLVRYERVDAAAGAAPAENAVDVATPASVSLTGAGTTGGFVKFDILFQNGVNSGTFSFNFAQNTATAAESAVVRAGSYMEWSVA